VSSRRTDTVASCGGDCPYLAGAQADRDRLREAARNVITAYMADHNLAPFINELEYAAGLGQQG
jgi:hypothetical protein